MDFDENPWDIKSVYEFLVYKCPVCDFSSPAKQKFVNHACFYHPESVAHFLTVNDGSVADVVIPTSTKLEEHLEPVGNHFLLDDIDYFLDDDNEVDDENEEKVEKKYKPKRKYKPREPKDPKDQKPSKNEPRCKECNELFKNYQKLAKHYFTAHASEEDSQKVPEVKTEVSEEPINCEKCHEEFPNSLELKQHSDTDHSSKCALCLNVLVPSEKMIKHLIEGHKRVELGCVACEIFCESEKDLQEHLQKCGNSITCPLCPSTYIHHKDLKKHVRQAHWKAAPPEPVTCHYCGVTKKSKSVMAAHIASKHERTQNHVCDECGKNFAMANNLRVHKENIHGGKKNYHCDQCGFGFYSVSDLKRHVQNVHEGQRNYQCPHCGKCCSRRQGLEKHIERAHKTDRKFPCDRCDRSFATKKEIEHHIITIHQGIKPYKCPDCGKDFSRQDNLNVHVRIVHRGIKGYKCQKCGKDFVRKKFLEAHICQPILITPLNETI